MTKSQSVHSALRIRLLGRFSLERAGKEIRLPTRQARLLLAYLALRQEPQSREKLGALLWPDVSDDSARASLRNTLSTLRTKIDRALLDSDRETVRINPAYPVEVDVVAFRREAEQYLSNPPADGESNVVDLYPDDLLIDDYDDWVIAERAALRELYLETLLEMTRRMRSAGRYGRAIELAGIAVALDPVNEHAHQHLMFCHLASGDRSAALKQYDVCRNALNEELDLAPSEETRRLHEWIRQTETETVSVEASVTNMPSPATPFIGREREIGDARDLLSSNRLVTLVGTGGSGKTRLAIEVAKHVLDSWPDGVWWVELATLTDPELVPRTVANVLGVPEVASRPVSETLERFLYSKRLLLVLDNCEHLVGACADLSETLLSGAPQMKILATSREALGIPAETVFPVPTLSTPDPDRFEPAEHLMKFEAVQLFVERARATNPELALGDENSSAVAELCHRLDGLPLAIELAAARVNVLGAPEIVSRLGDVFDLLTRGSRTALPRQQTLRGAIEWSFEMLDEDERALFRRLSVFSGGWTLNAAEDVCGFGALSANQIVDLLSRLVEKSLIQVAARRGTRRFRMLQTIWRYAHDRLGESGEHETIRTRHLQHFLSLLEQANPHLGYTLPDSELDHWLARLEPEGENLRAAIQWASERADLTDAGLRLLSLQHVFWFARGRFAEGQAWLERLLGAQVDVSKESRALALATLGYLRCWQGDFEGGGRPLEEALELFQDLGHLSGIAFATHGLGFVAVGTGNADLGRTRFQESLRTAKESNDDWITSFAMHFLAIVLQYQGEFELAMQYFDDGDEIIRGLGGHRQAIAFSRFHGGRIARIANDVATARSRHEEGLRLFREVGDRRGIGYSLAGLALLAAAERHLERAARLAGTVEAIESVLGSFLEAPLQAEYDREMTAVRDLLGETEFATAAGEGRVMETEEAVEYALRG